MPSQAYDWIGTGVVVRTVSLGLLTAIALAGSGCAAVKATQQPGKKNLSVLTQGTPRTHVIAELGVPLWSDQRDGATTDVFVFKQGYSKANKAGRALVHGAADVVTWGLWEVVGIPAESLADGKDVKVEVTYDERQSVRSVDVIQGEEVINPRPLFSRKPKPATADLTDAQGELDQAELERIKPIAAGSHAL